MEELAETQTWLIERLNVAINELGSLPFYYQIAFIAAALVLSWFISSVIRNRLPVFRDPPPPTERFDLRGIVYNSGALIFPVVCLILFGAATALAEEFLGEFWLVKIAQGVSVIQLVYRFGTHLLSSETARSLMTWIGLPIALLYVFGWLDDVTAQLEAVSFEFGNIHFSAYTIARTLIFGAVLFWLGRVSNNTGQRVIRKQQKLDASTKEVVAKLFQIGLFILIFILLLQVMGIDITTLVVFGGAIGVGLGFGLQQIAANFISGIIILLDRSITIEDYIELEDGRAGKLRELNMRYAILQTFDGKDIMVPNEQFITTAFTNWTHHNKKQRYSLNFDVAYETDLEAMFPIIRDIVASHPRVLSGDDLPLSERPDAEIEAFADSGITILVEFWMEGIDDGDNRVGADLLMMIWTALKENGISIPFPQREIRLLGNDQPVKNGG
ncbi:MAG: mechanosensitive ion channel family protein [Minwuia sp.]|uniref:mechanosensitive ion channel family protein n=1 Tax=Minwuia sp. TaxID=2493630 RepID=UPI003A888CE7